jgi:hypothetical protein
VFKYPFELHIAKEREYGEVYARAIDTLIEVMQPSGGCGAVLWKCLIAAI